jgi:arylsulfatase A-like enzyme
MSSNTPASRPNIVLICVDQWRADCLGIDGHPVVDTPYLDRFASQGCLFRRAYAATPTCIPARASLYTGLTQRTHGRVGYRDGVAWNYPVTIASAFRDQGYQTHCVGKMHVHPARHRMGFDSIDLHDGYMHFGRDRTVCDPSHIDDYLPWLRQRAGHDADYFDQGTHCNAYTPHPWDKDEMLHPSAWVSTMGADFLRRHDPTHPFFLMLSYHRPHPPLDPPAWAYQQYLDQDLPEPHIGDWVDEVLGDTYDPNECMQPPRQWPPQKIRRARAAYYGQLTFLDHQISRFWELLDEYGHANNTILCFVSDHGDMLGDHHQYAKSVAYEPSARVPLFFASPRSDLIPRGVMDNEHVAELRDVMPTLLDAAGLEIPDSVEGRSLLPLMRGEPTAWREYLHGEHIYHFADIRSMHYIVTSDWKYIWHSGTGREQLFHLAGDPNEMRDLAGQEAHAARLAELRGHLVGELTCREEEFVQDGKLVAGREVRPMLSHVTV